MHKEKLNEILSKLPKTDRILEHPKVAGLSDKLDKSILLSITREILKLKRDEIRRSFKGKKPNKTVPELKYFVDELVMKAGALFDDNLKKVVNATGTILHTNLGRAPLDKSALRKACDIASGYSNLEYDLETGKRGSRYDHFLEVVKLVTKSEAAIAVNNNAAAVLLVLNTFCEGKEAVVSRGELIEIGGAFRIPEVMEKSRAILREVGTTNKTHIDDYENALSKKTGMILKVHTSNYKIVGFTHEAGLDELILLGKKKRVIVYNDLGSGCLVDLSRFGIANEQTVQEVVKMGADIVSFSGDKLLGGPQAGIIVGKKKYIDMIKKNPLTRALRLDKMTISVLSEVFKKYLNSEDAAGSVPIMKMLTMKKAAVKRRCESLVSMLKKLKKRSLKITIEEDYSYVGGGALPLSKIETYVASLKSGRVSSAGIARKLRAHSIPVIVRVSDDSVLIDLRTVLSGEDKIISEAIDEIL